MKTTERRVRALEEAQNGGDPFTDEWLRILPETELHRLILNFTDKALAAAPPQIWNEQDHGRWIRWVARLCGHPDAETADLLPLWRAIRPLMAAKADDLLNLWQQHWNNWAEPRERLKVERPDLFRCA